MAKLASVIVPRPLKVSRGAKIGHGPFVPEVYVLRNRPSAVRAPSSTAIFSSSAASRSPVISRHPRLRRRAWRFGRSRRMTGVPNEAMAMERDGDEVHLSEIEASGAEQYHIGRWVLGLSLLLATALLSLIWISGTIF